MTKTTDVKVAQQAAMDDDQIVKMDTAGRTVRVNAISFEEGDAEFSVVWSHRDYPQSQHSTFEIGEKEFTITTVEEEAAKDFWKTREK